ncbi:MAG TPA: hypothetical protein VFB92_29000 [Vicinamibacterales bacterium]|nr:hypothetical protein [Vicinamibacterales bacterium]
MRQLGLRHKTAWELYQALRQEAGGGTRPGPNDVPDWTGLWVWNSSRGFLFDPDTPPGVVTTAKLTPEYQQKLDQEIARINKGIEYDPISSCAPPGHPRWLAIPFLREFIVTPDQTWLSSETVNNVRRIYTDGRDHIPEADRYPLYYGDSIGFWNNQTLTIHTNQLRAGVYQRGNPEYTDQVETVEIWEKVDDRTLEVDAWVYDPPALVEPWYVKQRYSKVSDQDKQLRIRYWDCLENPNNTVFKTQEGSTQFKDFTFTESDNEKRK